MKLNFILKSNILIRFWFSPAFHK